MPLLHQDTARGGGGGSSKEHRHSLQGFLSYESAHLSEPAAAPAMNHRNERNPDAEWVWEEPGSPEAAHTPRALVPSACFPPRHPRAFTSYSESARPGSGWADEPAGSGQGITDLVASLKALAMPGGAGGFVASVQALGYDGDKTVEQPWPPEQASAGAPPREDMRLLPRRASFSGVVGVARGEPARWSGKLPARSADPRGGYSPKLFLGGLPWDITEQALMHTLRHFQPVRVEWPGRDTLEGADSPRGFAYVTFESERRVRALLAASRHNGSEWFYRFATRKMRSKEAEVIPWAVSDSNWVIGGSVRLEPTRTVFVGALHGMLSAANLAYIMNELFSGVVYAGIDTDKSKYPIGSGRVTFNNVHSYLRAISAAYVEIRTKKFCKKVQVDPYLEDSMCSVCNLHQGPYFCREPVCFRYFCHSCWQWQHPNDDHKQLSRGSKMQAYTSPSNGMPSNGFSSIGPRPRHDTDHEHGSIYNGAMSTGTPSPTTSAASCTSTGGIRFSEYDGTELKDGGWRLKTLV